jgi:hypothetical protein
VFGVWLSADSADVVLGSGSRLAAETAALPSAVERCSNERWRSAL